MPVNRTASFPDLDTAQAVTQHVVDLNRARIHGWLVRESSERLTLTGYFHGEVTGLLQSRAMLYAGRPAYEVCGARVILHRDDAWPGGFRVFSTFPIEA
ncbi:MAG TPA: RNase A-like domain-containing protein [Actinospica sp.]|nr:RNase A-like domain-containing protein [Actinospica sp.]